MKKIYHTSEQLLFVKHERKRLKRLNKNVQYKGIYNGIKSVYLKEHNFRISVDKKIISTFKSNLYNYLVEQKFLVGSENLTTKIKIPKIFSLCDNYDTTIEVIRDIIASMWDNAGKEIVVDFSECKAVDQSALFLLQIIRLEIESDFNSLDKKLSVLKTKTTFDFIRSSESSVNLHLLLGGYLVDANLDNGIKPIDTLGYIKGSKSQKHYFENKKGVIGTRILNYIDKCLMDNLHCLTPTGKNDIGNMITEILNNAEDHSPLNTYYVNATYYVDDPDESNLESHVGVLNLSFLNFGYSFYEGFEETKEQNSELYCSLDKAYTNLGNVPFSKENLFTLYALQDGISRLKFEDKSRGTGTMTFINCFFTIGDYENIERSLSPQLSILSGSTQLICDNKYRTFEHDNGYFSLSLNRENDLNIPPDKDNLKSLKYRFPGTILSVKFCLNKNQIQNKINGNENK